MIKPSLLITAITALSPLALAAETTIVSDIGHRVRIQFQAQPGLRVAKPLPGPLDVSIQPLKSADSQVTYEAWCTPLKAGDFQLRDYLVTPDGHQLSGNEPAIRVTASATLPAEDAGRIESAIQSAPPPWPVGPIVLGAGTVLWCLLPAFWVALRYLRRRRVSAVSSAEALADPAATLRAFLTADEAALSDRSQLAELEAAYWAAWQARVGTPTDGRAVLRDRVLNHSTGATSAAVVDRWLYGTSRPSLDQLRDAMRAPLREVDAP